MKYRQLGTSDLKIPVITFGAWAIGGWMWGGTDDEKAIRAVQQAVDEGITCIDTAPTYGRGHSETIVGKAIAGRRDSLIIATKCGVRWDLEEGQPGMTLPDEQGVDIKMYRNLRAHSIKYECERSLKRLGVDTIDLYQCHWPDETTPLEETMGALLDLQREGKIRHIGVSNFTTRMMEECLKHGQIVSDQPKYNPLEREIEADVLPFCREHNIGVLAYSPIAQGLMTGKVTMDRTFREGDLRAGRPWFQPNNRRRVLDKLERIKPMADKYGVTLAQLTIAWIIAQPGITSAIVGARDDAQVRENARAAEITLEPDDIATFRQEVEALGAPD